MMGLDTARYTSSLNCAAAIARGGGVRALFLGLTYAAYPPSSNCAWAAYSCHYIRYSRLLACVSSCLPSCRPRVGRVFIEIGLTFTLFEQAPLLTTYYVLFTMDVLTKYYSLLHPPRAGLACPQQAALTKGW